LSTFSFGSSAAVDFFFSSAFGFGSSAAVDFFFSSAFGFGSSAAVDFFFSSATVSFLSLSLLLSPLRSSLLLRL
jgi:hypothetical protein